jgi:aconitate hydratase
MIKTRIADFGGGRHTILDLPRSAGKALERLPYLHRIFLENILRHGDAASLEAVGPWLKQGESAAEIAFHPARILMHDTTCGPALVDIAAARSALAEAGADPAALHPLLPVDVSTDHSVAVDSFGTPDALRQNMQTELRRNAERYGLMRWASAALGNVRVHPPGTGIMHTINLERLATLVTFGRRDGRNWAIPDTLIGTDSHTPMISGIGVLAWGVGGLEAESVMFGQPVMMRIPRVIGVRLTGALAPGITATDLALVVTERLRQIKLDNGFVEFFGPGVASLSAGVRCTVANMAPEYGAATGFFPPDQRTLGYLAQTGRNAAHIADAATYLKLQRLWLEPDAAPHYSQVVELDLSAVTMSVSGPTRPQDRLAPSGTRAALEKLRGKPMPEAGDILQDGAVAIAAITSCTNTSDPRLLVTAGLLARKARALGLKPKSWVKTSLAPGSPATGAYLARAGLLGDLEALGFAIVGYGCTTCIGNSGPLTDEMRAAMERGVQPVAVLSGNRNFPGRVHAALDAAFLASPPLVIGYALAGSAVTDIAGDPLGISDGKPVFLRDIWPSEAEIDAAMAKADPRRDYAPAYDAAEASPDWQALKAPTAALYAWDKDSTYLRRPPFATADQPTRLGSYDATPLLVLGDDVTTDHISPAGSIAPDGEAGRYLVAHGEDPADLNVFSSRRGNWEVMVRGLFTNRTVKNLLGKDIPPGATIHAPDGAVMPLWQAAAAYAQARRPVVIVAGARYGAGSSRDWAAKGAALLGVRAVLAVSFERIHRSNLANMGVLPLILPDGVTPQSLALGVGDRIYISAPPDYLVPHARIPVTIAYADGRRLDLQACAGVETANEIAVLAAGGVLPLILREKLRQAAA